MRIEIAAVILAAAALVAADGEHGKGAQGHGEGHGKKEHVFSFAHWGDQPYYTTDALVGKYLLPAHDYTTDPFTQNLVNSMKADKDIQFAIHVGDTKSGKTSCNNLLDDTMFNLFDTKFNVPQFYSIGDNEWTDCHRTSTKFPTNPLDRLDYVRSKFFSTNRPLGPQPEKDLEIETQAYMGYPENRRWSYGPVTFATIHVPGSNNNVAAPLDKLDPAQCDLWITQTSPADGAAYNCKNKSARSCPDCIGATQEFIHRNAADVQWLREAFAAATHEDSKGIVIAIQADMTATDANGDPTNVLTVPFVPVVGGKGANDGYKEFATALQEETKKFLPRQVLLLHGDNHFYLNVEGEYGDNFRRIMNPGESLMNWVKITVDPSQQGRAFFTPTQIIANAAVHLESL